MNQTLIKQKLTNYAAQVQGGQPLFYYPAVVDYVKNLPGFDCILPEGRVEVGERSSPREIIWSTDSGGDLRPFKDLSDAEQVKVRSKVNNAIEMLHREARSLKDDESKSKRDLGQVLEKIDAPPDDFIYMLNGKPVITGWGLVEEGPEPKMETTDLSYGPSKPLPVTPVAPSPKTNIGPEPPTSGPAVRAPIPPVDKPPVREEPKSRWWLWLLLALFLLALLAALLWYLLTPEAPAPIKPVIQQTKPQTELQKPQPREPKPEAPATIQVKAGEKNEKGTEIAVTPEATETTEEMTAAKTKVLDKTTGIYYTVPQETKWWKNNTIVWDQTLKEWVWVGPYKIYDYPEVTPYKELVPSSGAIVQGDRRKVLQLTLSPPDSAAVWKVTVDPDSSAAVLKNPDKHIVFIAPTRGLETVGPTVELSVSLSKPLKATVTAKDSKGSTSAYPISVYGSEN
jgi:hypothetical protein